MSRLRFTFLFIVAMVTIAVTIGSLQLGSLWNSQQRLLAQSVPSLLQTEELARELTALLAVTSELNEQQTQDGLVRLQAAIDTRHVAIRDVIASLPAAGSTAPIQEEFADVQRRLERSVNTLISLRGDILRVRSALRTSASDIETAGLDFAGIIEPLLTDAAGTLERSLASSDAADTQSGIGPTRQKDVSALIALTELVFQVSLAINAAEQLSLSVEPSQAPSTVTRLQLELQTIGQLLPKLKDNADRQALARKVEALRALIFGPGGVNRNLQELAKVSARFQSEKATQLDLTRTISDISNRFVTLAKQDIDETALSLDKSLLTTLAVLTATLIVTVLVIAGVSFFVVERQINRRMARLTAAVRRIASGNTEHDVSVAGPDELGEMAKALEVFKENARELRRSNEELQKFAYVASHDLRSPLQAIKNLAEWTLEDAGDSLPPEGRSNLQLMLQRVDRLSSLLFDLLEYAQAGQAESSVAEIDVKETVLDLAELVDPSGRYRLEFSGNVRTIETYTTPLRQILLNLINNAAKHHDEDHGQIVIDVRKTGRRIRFAVTDDGPGINPAYHDRVFGLFETLKSRDEVEGSGLGLAIIRKLVEHHGGTISIASNPQRARGATFAFDFPDLREQAQARSAA